jgi:hypothetical protein
MLGSRCTIPAAKLSGPSTWGLSLKGSKHIWIVGGEARCRDTLAQALESGGAFRVTDAVDAPALPQMIEQRRAACKGACPFTRASGVAF